MKEYTDLEQSKKLAQILPLETADMYYDGFGRLPQGYAYTLIFPNSFEYDKPAWSLAALLQVLPIKAYIETDNICCTLDISRDTLGKWFVYYHNRSYGSSLVTCTSKELLDACYEMISKLHELNLLKF